MESRLKGLDEREWKFEYSQGFKDLFPPIEGHDKKDVFKGEKK